MHRIQSPFPRLRALITTSIFLILGVLVSGCVNALPPPCPPVRVDSITATMTKFKDGASRDLSNVEYQVEIVGFQGECVFTGGRVEVLLDVDFQVTSGPAGLTEFIKATKGRRLNELG